ncbi:ATP-grasp domain-containing protein [Enterococcus timonensis]|uniref:ATP-grasp domain-containing protein n=1 Tax=Enterococcus timonensis TaxID=1852364 RepID=UPI0008D9407B|nr:ATP-grasp domain-containing protein [Enterococcus timonensis]
MDNKIPIGSTVGIIGGNEKGRALAIAAKKMGMNVGLLDPDSKSPASRFADWQITADFFSEEAMAEIAQNCQVVTYANEDLPPEELREFSFRVNLPQGADFLEITQNRSFEKAYFEDNNLVVAPYATIVLVTDIQEAIDGIGYPCVLKLSEKKSLGRGQIVLYSPADLRFALDLLRFGPCVLEAWIPKEREITATVVRNEAGEISVFPVVETVYRKNQLHQALLPARIEPEIELEAQRIATVLAENFGVCGTLTVELFVGKLGALFINEMSSVMPTSAFIFEKTCTTDLATQHWRSLFNWSLGKSKVLTGGVMVSVLGSEALAVADYVSESSVVDFQYYQREEYLANDRIGQLTILGDDLYETLENLYQTKIWE